jgi:hypothetical protein
MAEAQPSRALLVAIRVLETSTDFTGTLVFRQSNPARSSALLPVRQQWT